ncbi:PAS domain S-box protein [Chitinimonas sp. BJB300]|uniref:PAS domain S-box protein n=1 Tax=Chitinimonas sp. BJB300 TaxID=1559339 RepID=UPI001304784D|nr:PAS domain S-box protein [Chitinimonas sp. BJB300]
MSVNIRKYFPNSPILSEAAMVESFKHTRAILTNLKTVLFALTPSRDRLLYLSSSAAELYGESVGVLRDHPNFWLEAVHPDDKAAAWMGLDKLRVHERDKATFTYRLISADGDTQWVCQQCRLISNEAGLPIRIECMITPTLPPAVPSVRHDIGNAVFTATADALLVRDANTLDILDANAAALALLACSRAELLRQRLSDFSARTEGFDTRAEAGYIDAVRQGLIQRYDWLVAPHYGPPRWVEAVSSPIRHAGRDCLLTALHDVDKQRHERQQQGVYEELVERSLDAVAWADTGGKLHSLNQAGQRMLRVQPEVVGDLFLTDLLPAWAQPHFLQTCLPLATSEGRWHGELALLSRDGRNLPVALTLLAHKQNGTMRGYSLIAQDIAPYKLREHRYKKEKESLEADTLLKEKLLENICAGLLQPLTQLRLLAELLEKHPEEVARALPHLKRTVGQARRLVDASSEFISAGAQRDLP